MRPAKKLECKIIHWRDKSKSQTKIIASQKSKLERRDNKLAKAKQEISVLKRANDRLKQQLLRAAPMGSTRVKHHTYSAQIIQLCLLLRSTSGCSYRGCVNTLKVLVLTLGWTIKIPSIASIRNWEIKYGYYNLDRRAPNNDPWALIIDESVSIGSEKLLLLLGVNLNTYDFKDALSHDDVRVLDVRLSKSWKAEDISKVIEDVKARNYNISYACSDSGNNLCKALTISNISRIADCGHKFGHWLKKTYQNDDEFLGFRKKSNDMKKRLILSKVAELVPPKLRAKGRYLNISAIVKWADALLVLCKKYKRRKHPPQIFEKISWLVDHAKFIGKLSGEQHLINKVNQVLKTQGLGKKSSDECRTLIKASRVCKSLKSHIETYLSEHLELVQDKQKVICSSDVIESMFGLFKYRNSKNPGSSITQSCLTIASYGEKVEMEEVKKAMEAVSIADLQAWRSENLSETVAQRRRKLFQKSARKQALKTPAF